MAERNNVTCFAPIFIEKEPQMTALVVYLGDKGVHQHFESSRIPRYRMDAHEVAVCFHNMQMSIHCLLHILVFFTEPHVRQGHPIFSKCFYIPSQITI